MGSLCHDSPAFVNMSLETAQIRPGINIALESSLSADISYKVALNTNIGFQEKWIGLDLSLDGGFMQWEDDCDRIHEFFFYSKSGGKIVFILFDSIAIGIRAKWILAESSEELETGFSFLSLLLGFGKEEIATFSLFASSTGSGGKFALHWKLFHIGFFFSQMYDGMFSENTAPSDVGLTIAFGTY